MADDAGMGNVPLFDQFSVLNLSFDAAFDIHSFIRLGARAIATVQMFVSNVIDSLRD